MTYLILFLLFSLAIVTHEYAHGYVAYRLGDPTPKITGRLTFNPLRHIDVLGTIFMPLFLYFVTGGRFVFGFAKPIVINPYNFKDTRKGILFVGLSGPISNFLLAVFLSILYHLNPFIWFREPLAYGIVINLVIGVFNLLPIPPLDGSKIVASLLSYRIAYRYLRIHLLGFIIIPLLILIGFIDWFIIPIVRGLLGTLGIYSIIL